MMPRERVTDMVIAIALALAMARWWKTAPVETA